jgi:hypothetical protein
MLDERRWLRDALARLFIEVLPQTILASDLSTNQLLEIDTNATASFLVERQTIASECDSLIKQALAAEALYKEVAARILSHSELRSAFAALRNMAECSESELQAEVLSTVSLLYRKFAALSNDVPPSRAVFARWWPEVRAELFDSKHVAIRLLLLSDVEVDKPYKLSPSLIIRPDNDRDRERRAALSDNDRQVVSAKTILESIDVIGDKQFAPSEDERALDVAFSVLCGAPLSVVYIEQYLTSFRGWGGTTTSSPVPRARWYSHGPVFITSDARAADLAQFLDDAKKAMSKHVVDLAARRYVSGLSRRGVADGFIDYWIALEGLFGEKGGELVFRLALRLAAFLGSGGAERQRIFASAKASYDLRSQLVHGSSANLDMAPINAAELMIRQALYKIIRSPKSYNRSTMEAELLAGTELATNGMSRLPPMPAFD